MHNFDRKRSRNNLLLMFTFIITLTLLSFPTDVSAKSSYPEVKILHKTVYTGYKQYRISISNLAKNATVTYKSDNTKVAKVDNNNMVTGINQGEATIAVTIKQNGHTYKDSIAITVKAPYIRITEYADTMEVNSSKTWNAKVYGSANTTLTWSTSDASVVTVNRETGKLTAHSSGKVIITAESGNLRASKTVIVPKVVPMKSEKEQPVETVKAKDFVLEWDVKLEVLPNGGFDRVYIIEDNLPSSPVWSVSNTNLATIDQDGWVTAAATGTGTVHVTAKVGNKQISAPLLILSEEDYTDYIHGYYKPDMSSTEYYANNDEEVPTQAVTPILTAMPDVTPIPNETPGNVTPKPTPKISPKPVINPTPVKNTSGYTYEISTAGIAITGLTDKNIQNVVIPCEINGKTVVRIKYKAFNNLENLQSIVIPDTVTSIEFEAIKACPNLESLTIPASVTDMKDIYDCPKLKYLTIGMEKIDGIKFRNCKGLERITVLEGVKEIGGFGYLHSLKEVILPESIQVISRNAFTYCINLARINIPNGMAEIGEKAFENCSSLTGLSISESFMGSIGEYAFDETPIGSIEGAYKYGCLAILSSSDRMLLDKALGIIGSLINPSDIDGLKVLAIHDWIVKNTEYDYDNYVNGTVPNSSYEVEGVLLYHRAVCEGYAGTFQFFMDLLNIPCKIVYGMAKGEGHGWNLVYLDGEWYHIDCTWDDPVPDGGPDYVRYNYCLIPDMIMEQLDHEWIRSNYQAAYGTTWTDYVNDNK